MKRLSVFLVSFLLAMCAFNAHAVQTKPPTSTSWYVYIANPETDLSLQNWMETKGYAMGQLDLNTPGTQSSVVILEFGKPKLSGGVYGASGLADHFLSVSVMKECARRFALGYYIGTGSDTTSQLRILLGTNNSGINVETDQFLTNHGAAWVQMVKDTAVAIQSYASQVAVRGGNDIEPDYSTPGKAISWVNGYLSGFVSPHYMYNFGSADGCPTSGTTSTPGACNNGWTQNDIEYISWRAQPASSLPQIYATAGGNAKQWQQIALYSYLAYSQDMFISAPLSQSQACAQKVCPYGTNNTPDQAWTQLWTELNGDSRTVQSLNWSTDIKWR